ncbi:MAG TPA: hypothetical protein VMU42_17165 [Candidatus Sulfotelmatobacter sp.]|nr:hypothetical protein [Candidatus Sulfotelmatobacter sp.]
MPPQDLTREPRLDDAFEDSIVRALMASDCVTIEELRRLVDAARRRLADRAENVAT